MSVRIKAGQKGYRNWLARMMKEHRFAGIIAFVGERQGRAIIGSGGIWLHEIHPMPWLDGENEPYILSVYTEKGFRGLGVASRIMKVAMKWCRKKGYRSARLNASKMGRGLYSSLGWKRTWEMRRKL
ncbi:MAG TPA: GNAT family N-acetyltransferase [Nitrososphaerales archaeon]|nr:GNAT family N-acetyltransferase [Nitrososphaerales archaeon]